MQRRRTLKREMKQTNKPKHLILDWIWGKMRMEWRKITDPNPVVSMCLPIFHHLTAPNRHRLLRLNSIRMFIWMVNAFFACHSTPYLASSSFKSLQIMYIGIAAKIQNCSFSISLSLFLSFPIAHSLVPAPKRCHSN